MSAKHAIAAPVIGWLVLIVLFSPVLIGAVLGGPQGMVAGLLVWVVIFVVLVVSLVAVDIGRAVLGDDE